MVEKHLVARLVSKQPGGFQRVAVAGVVVGTKRVTHGVAFPFGEPGQREQLPETLLVVVHVVIARHLSGALRDEGKPRQGNRRNLDVANTALLRDLRANRHHGRRLAHPHAVPFQPFDFLCPQAAEQRQRHRTEQTKVGIGQGRIQQPFGLGGRQNAGFRGFPSAAA